MKKKKIPKIYKKYPNKTIIDIIKTVIIDIILNYLIRQ